MLVSCQLQHDCFKPNGVCGECQLTLKAQVVVGFAVAPEPQSVHESSISVLDAEVVRLQRTERP